MHTHACTQACMHTHTLSITESIKSHLINLLIRLNSTIYLRGGKGEETSSHVISLIASSESETPAHIGRLLEIPGLKVVTGKATGTHPEM